MKGESVKECEGFEPCSFTLSLSHFRSEPSIPIPSFILART